MVAIPQEMQILVVGAVAEAVTLENSAVQLVVQVLCLSDIR
jgi:hypothetical protein